MIDVHCHTNYSPDSKELPENLVKAAIDCGCKILGFSEHLDYDYVANNLDVIMTDVKAYFQNTEMLKQKYKDKIKILCGIEIGYDKNAESYYNEVFSQYQFDYIINSVHVAGGKDCYFQPYFEGKTIDEAYDCYINAVKKSVETNLDYQILGHIGYVIRNAPYKDNKLDCIKYKDILDEILTALIKKQKVLEINTNVISSHTITLPYAEIIKRYHHLGGKLFSYGSDCHAAVRICHNYNAVTDMLKNLGIKELVYFENKQMNFYKI